MSLIRGIARELFGLFVDDGAFALAILAAVAASALVALGIPGGSELAGFLLPICCLALLFVSAVRAAR